MKTFKIRVGNNGRITIPIEVRRQLNLMTGDTIIFEIVDQAIKLRKATPREQKSLRESSTEIREGGVA